MSSPFYPLQHHTVGHRSLQLLATKHNPWLLSSNSCQPPYTDHHSTKPEGVLHCVCQFAISTLSLPRIGPSIPFLPVDRKRRLEDLPYNSVLCGTSLLNTRHGICWWHLMVEHIVNPRARTTSFLLCNSNFSSQNTTKEPTEPHSRVKLRH